METNKPFKPIYPIIGGLLEPVTPPSEQFVLWEGVMQRIIESSQKGTLLGDIILELETNYEIKTK
jgi:hypothetical protein